MQQLEKLFTEKQVSEYLQIPPSTLRKHRCWKQGIPYLKIEGAVRYRFSDIQEYLEKATTKNKK